MLSFDEYIVRGGRIQDQETYEELEPMVVQLVDAYIKTQIPFWRVRSIEEYFELDLSMVIVLEIDFIAEHGGIDAFYGKSDMNFKSATTSGFSYSLDNSKSKMFYDIPMSAIAKAELDYQLLKSGLRGAALW